MVSVVAEETLEADGAKTVLAESLDIFGAMNLALRVNVSCHTINRFGVANIQAIVGSDRGSRVFKLVTFVSLHLSNFFRCLTEKYYILNYNRSRTNFAQN